jgi:outer membrane receptor protein involved in Fe transport
VLVLSFVIAGWLGTLEAPPATVRGRVTDRDGVSIADARIRVSGTEYVTTADSEGVFQLSLSDASRPILLVEAPGYVSVRHIIRDSAEKQQVILERPRYLEERTVTATRMASRVTDSAGSVVIIDGEELRGSAAPAIDEVLRQVPGFTLFRRSGSRTANPTVQGVSLRGIGASGASRAVVLDDGIPLNDPFGGWVYWGRVPRASIERLEVLRGGGSELYGSGALSGVVQLIRRSDPEGLEVSTSYGSEETAEASLFGAFPVGSWSMVASAELFRTDGYVPVRQEERGLVDQQANSRRATAELSLSHAPEEQFRWFARASFFDESRANGTPMQTNDTSILQFSGGANWLGSRTAGDLRLYAMDQLYHQSFSAISADRSSERLNRRQEVPVEACGLGGHLVHSRGAHSLVAGVDVRAVKGFTEEEGFGPPATRVKAGGRQRIGGAFLEDVFQPASRLTITAAARLDVWENIDASTVTGGITTRLRDREETALSPRLTALYRLSDRLSLTGATYRAFRAPTLNELYRSFRVGNVVTLANENLQAERLTGSEAGLILARPHFVSRITLFDMAVEKNVANVTLRVQPELITRQRQNLGRTRSRGLELDLQAIIGSIELSAGYLLVDAEVRSFPANRELEGLDVAQVPRHQATVQLRLPHFPLGELNIQARWNDDQFEDDQNQLRLAGYTVADIFLGRRLTPALQAFLAIENLFDQQFEVGKTPVTTIGPPRSVRLGITMRSPVQPVR